MSYTRYRRLPDACVTAVEPVGDTACTATPQLARAVLTPRAPAFYYVFSPHSPYRSMSTASPSTSTPTIAGTMTSFQPRSPTALK